MNAERVDCYKCDTCSELIPKDYINEADGFKCGECGEIYDNEFDAEECCKEEDD